MKTYLKAKNMQTGKEYDVYHSKGLYYIHLQNNLIGILSIACYEPSALMFYRHYHFNGKICEVIVSDFQYIEFQPSVNQLALF